MDFKLYFIIMMFACIDGARLKSDGRVLNICMDGKHHESYPAKRELYGICKQWEPNGCCSNETSYESQQPFSNLYNFNFSHCSEMSSECMKWFSWSNCFYECSPNTGPWLRPDRSTLRNEKYYHVPLCRNQCDSWWDACKNERTCVSNWSQGFNWTSGSNRCPKEKPCKNFTEIYQNATNFCQSVFPGDFKVSDDASMCVVFNFTGPDNPNSAVALAYATKNNMSLDVSTATTHAPAITVHPPTTAPPETAVTAKPPATTTATASKPPPSPTGNSSVVSSAVTTIDKHSGTVIAAAIGITVTVLLVLVLVVCKIRTSEEGIRCFPCYAWFARGSTASTHFRVPTDEQAFLDPDADDESPHGELELTL